MFVLYTSCSNCVADYREDHQNWNMALAREPPPSHLIGPRSIEQLYRMGICISYDRVMEIENWIAISTCERFKEDGHLLVFGPLSWYWD